MKLKNNCYIENSKEAREWLKMLGWKENIWSENDDMLSAYMTLNIPPAYISFKKGSEGIFLSLEDVDCRGNLPLFKALTAVRDDSDYMQWFTDGVNWLLCESDKINKLPIECYKRFAKHILRKATQEELIEKFKKKKQ